jgi:hypothetical protein
VLWFAKILSGAKKGEGSPQKSGRDVIIIGEASFRSVVEFVAARTSKIYNFQHLSHSALQQVQNKAIKNRKNPQISTMVGIWFGTRRSAG